jgi:hypothetical protein
MESTLSNIGKTQCTSSGTQKSSYVTSDEGAWGRCINRMFTYTIPTATEHSKLVHNIN